MALTPEQITNAAAIVNDWYWQAAEGHNYRWTHAVKSLTRFYESAPLEADQLQLVIEYLRTQDNITELFVHGKKLTYTDAWKAKDAWFQTMQSEKWAGTDSAKVRIYQTLIQNDVDGDGDGPYTVENGCQYKITHEFYWDVSELPNLPNSSSGVNYTLQGVTRDRETGLICCVVEKRERVQQDIALYESAMTIFETREEEMHLGVKQSDVARTGLPASADNGIIVERQLSKNPDCTTNIQNVKKTEKPVSGAVKEFRKTLRGVVETTVDRNQADPVNDGTGQGQTPMEVGETRRSEKTPGKLHNNTIQKVTPTPAGKVLADCQKTAFEHIHAETINQEEAPESDEVPEAADGVIVEQTDRLTDENNHDVTTKTTTEKPVSAAVKEFRKTMYGVIEATTDRNQSDPVNDGTGQGQTPMEVGETRRSEKTPGKLHNNTIQKLTARATSGTLAKSCVKSGTGSNGSGKVHTDLRTEIVSEMGENHVTGQDNKQIEEAYRANPDTGVVEKTTRTTEYKERIAEVSWTGNGGTFSYKTYSHTPSIPTVTTPAGGKAQALFTQNEHGSYDGYVSKFTPTDQTSGSLYEQSGLTHVIVETRIFPGGIEKKREVTITYSRGACNPASAVSKPTGGKSYGGFTSWARGSEWCKVTDVSFGAWSTL